MPENTWIVTLAPRFQPDPYKPQPEPETVEVVGIPQHKEYGSLRFFDPENSKKLVALFASKQWLRTIRKDA